MTPMPAARDPILVLDTATTRAVLAIGRLDGSVAVATDWVAGYRHGEELLVRLGSLLDGAGLRAADLGAIVVGIGPGAFTGLRVGIATAKGLAHALGVPLVGVSTGEALLEAAAVAGPPPGRAAASAGVRSYVLLQPAGPADRVITRPGVTPRILPGGSEPELGPGEVLVAVDLVGREAGPAVELGERARGGLAAALARRGSGRFVAGEADDLAQLVPEYVTLPRGVRNGPLDDAIAVTGRMMP